MNATTKTETNEPSPTTDDCAECERTRDAKNDACIAYKDAHDSQAAELARLRHLRHLRHRRRPRRCHCRRRPCRSRRSSRPLGALRHPRGCLGCPTWAIAGSATPPRT